MFSREPGMTSQKITRWVKKEKQYSLCRYPLKNIHFLLYRNISRSLGSCTTVCGKNLPHKALRRYIVSTPGLAAYLRWRDF